MSKRDGHQAGPQDHAEGAHGSKTHQALLQQLHSKANAPAPAQPEGKSEKNSQRRLTQHRQQHDEGEKNSEKTRLSREMERGNIAKDATSR